MLSVVLGDVEGVGVVAVAVFFACGGGQVELEVAALGDGVFRLDALPVEQGLCASLFLGERSDRWAAVHRHDSAVGGVVVHVGQRGAHLVDAGQREEVARRAVAHDAAAFVRLRADGNAVGGVGMLRAEAVANLVGYRREVVDHPCAALLVGAEGAAELCHTVAVVVGPADEDAQIVLRGVGAEGLVDDFLALEEAGVVGGVLVEHQAIDVVVEEDELLVVHHLELDAHVFREVAVEAGLQLGPKLLHLCDHLVLVGEPSVALIALDVLGQDAGGESESVDFASVLDDRLLGWIVEVGTDAVCAGAQRLVISFGNNHLATVLPLCGVLSKERRGQGKGHCKHGHPSGQSAWGV